MENLTLKQARNLAGLSRKEVSERIGSSVWTIKNWEEGKTSPRVNQFMSLCKLYDISPADIFLPER